MKIPAASRRDNRPIGYHAGAHPEECGNGQIAAQVKQREASSAPHLMRKPAPVRLDDSFAGRGTPPETVFGEGALEQLPDILHRSGARRVFIVASRETIAGRLPTSPERLFSGFEVRVFSDFEPVPKIGDLHESLKAVGSYAADAIVAIGGGTAMDLAKLTAILVSQVDAEPESFLRGQRTITAPRKNLLVLVPTTSGTGSEVTQFATVYIDQQKFSLDHPYVAADHALVDPRLTWSMSPTLSAATGLDALSQAIESYWSVRSTETSRGYAAASIELVLVNLLPACLDPTRVARERMGLAAMRAGQAINITRTTAAHAVSYPLTALHGIAHGHACALTLPHFLSYNALVSREDVLDPRGESYVRARIQDILKLLGATTAEMGRQRLTELTASVGLPVRLSDLGITQEGVDGIVAQSFNPERVANNPRRVSKEALRRMLLDIL